MSYRMSRNVKDLEINYIFLFLKKCILYFYISYLLHVLLLALCILQYLMYIMLFMTR